MMRPTAGRPSRSTAHCQQDGTVHSDAPAVGRLKQRTVHREQEIIMSRTVVVRYKTRADAADENQRLVEQGFAQLATEDPGGLRYATFRLAEGVAFVHIAGTEGEVNPRAQDAGVADVHREISGRCVQPPAP